MNKTLKMVATELQNLGYNANMDNTGGGIMGIYVTRPEVSKVEILLGNNCGWGADIYDEEGEYQNSVSFDEIQDSDSPYQIAYTFAQGILAQHLGIPLHYSELLTIEEKARFGV